MSKQLPEFPLLRSDLEIIAQPAPGKSDRYVVKDPRSGNVVELSEKEIFICRQLDGHTSLSVIASRIQEKYNFQIPKEQLEAFIRQLDEQVLLVSSVPKTNDMPEGWDAMKPLPFYFDQLFTTLSRVLRGVFSRWFCVTFSILSIVAIIIISKSWHFIMDAAQQYYGLLTGDPSLPFSAQNAFALVLFFFVFPLMREMCKAITCRHYGGRVPEVRFMWYMRFIPRFASDITSISGMKEKKHQLHIVVSGSLCEWLLAVIGIIGWKIIKIADPINSFWSSFTFASLTSFLFNLIPLGKGDGSLLFSLWLEIKDFRNRAIKVARSWVLRKPIPEPLTFQQRSLFRWYGLLADGYYIVASVFVFGLIGYLLVRWMSGVGCILFLVLLVLRFENEIRKFIPTVSFFRWLGPYCFKNGKVKAWVLWVGVALFLLVPYHYEVAGEFRIQPHLKRGIRAEVKGQIESVLIKEGAWVKAGDIVVSLSKRDILKELNVAKATLEEASAKFEGAKLKSDYSQQEFARAKQLYEEEQISTQDYEDRQRERDLDIQQYCAQKAEVLRLQTLVAYYEEDLVLTDIRSPIDGRITSPYTDEKLNNELEVGDSVAMVEDMRTVLVEIDVPEQYVAEVKIGGRVHAKTWTYPGSIFIGKVITIASVAADYQEVDSQQTSVTPEEKSAVHILNTDQKRIIRVIAELPNSDGRLKSGMTGFAKVKAGWNPLGAVLISEITRFFSVEVWSWLP